MDYCGNAATMYMVFLVVLLCAFGTANSILMKLTANAFGQDYAFFVDQGNNVLYLLFSIVAVIGKINFTSDIGPKEYSFPQYKFILMAVADAGGTFLAFLGAVFTPGQYQTVLNQTLIPVTMVVATCLLRAKYKPLEVMGAGIVLAGAVVTVFPSIVSPGQADTTQFRVYAACLYFLSNFPMAFSACYKEIGFKNVDLDCFWLTMWVSLYQVIISFAYAPLQALPGFGSEQGIPQHMIWSNFVGGVHCAFGQPSPGSSLSCDSGGLLLVAYSSVNFLYNCCGLLLMKVGAEQGNGAVLSCVAYALVVPVSNVVFSLPLVMGSAAEPFTGWTAGGLLLVMLGFVTYVYNANQKQKAEAEGGADGSTPLLGAACEESHLLVSVEVEGVGGDSAEEGKAAGVVVPPPAKRRPWGFHDRVVGVVSSGTVRQQAQASSSWDSSVYRGEGAVASSGGIGLAVSGNHAALSGSAPNAAAPLR